ncbi:hypothetical protein ACJJIW_00370 [Microbulbifer sp. JMSA004]|uniref:hypothetical protein n=1 Tax=unclassified Microbulbifer TaxID=2619833 RepID=UPI0024ADCD63|nr:hypothetical protein [Microbulbifer sp. VAAF005]WHI48191.1 hypothetical protein P0078_07410 [Microbulbifer sp. VAAF005]
MRSKLAAILTAGLLSTHSYAAEYSGWTTIEQISLGWGTKRVNLTLKDEMPDPLDCSDAVYMVQADESAPNLDHILSIALSAHTAGKEVNLIIDDSNCSAGGNIKLLSILIR